MVSVRKRRWQTKGATLTAWIVDYRDNAGIRRQRTFSLKRSADRFMVQLNNELSDASHVAASQSVTVEQACKLWVERTERLQLERSTYDDYEQVARLHIIPLIGNIKLIDLTEARIERFRDELLDTRSYDRASRALLHLKMALEDARRIGLTSKNPAKDVRIKGRARHRSDVEILSKKELVSFLGAAKDTGERENAFAHLLLAGMRASEIRGLPWENTMLDAGTVHVRQRADRWGKLGPPKTRTSRRAVPLTPSGVSALKVWRDKSGGGELVFPHHTGRPLYYSEVIVSIFDPIMFAANLTTIGRDGKIRHRYSLHAFRHTAASILIELGVSAKRVSRILGHSSIQTTFDLYGHLIDLRHSEAEMMQQVEDALRDGD